MLPRPVVPYNRTRKAKDRWKVDAVTDLSPLIDVEREGDLIYWRNFFNVPANNTTNVLRRLNRAQNTCSRPSPSTAWDQGWMCPRQGRSSIMCMQEVAVWNVSVIPRERKRKREEEEKERGEVRARNVFICKQSSVSWGLLTIYTRSREQRISFQ